MHKLYTLVVNYNIFLAREQLNPLQNNIPNIISFTLSQKNDFPKQTNPKKIYPYDGSVEHAFGVFRATIVMLS